MNIQTFEIAFQFSMGLRKALSPDQITVINARNAAESNPSVCHSHDFCDANEVMDDAFRNVTGASVTDPETVNDDANLSQWNIAWSIARAARFKPLSILKQFTDSL
jgi:hypothetical protein